MKQYDKQFKEQAVKLVLDLERPVKIVAGELGIHENTLYKWINQYRKHQEHAFPGSGNQRPEEAEIKRLKKMIADLEEENAILKKAAAIFAKHPR
ncbi:MAG: transposase [Syntrophomonadaceae bacterium]|nr:transposase [Syntrophomonadaceae bacterium]